MQSRIEMTEYVVPMMAFEKSMVMEVRAYLKDRDEATFSNVRAFDNWKWSQLIQDYLRDCLDTEGDQLHLEAGGNRSRAYKGCFVGLENYDHYGKHRARITQIKEMNPNFLNDLGERLSGSIKAVPDPNDEDYWDILDSIVEAFGRPWDTPEDLDRHFGKFDIFSLVRMYFLHSLFPLSANSISETITAHNTFLQYYTLIEDDVQGGQLGSENAFNHRIIKKRNDFASDLSEEELLGLLLSLAFANKRYPDPRAYLSYLNYDDLEPTSWSSLEGAVSGPDGYSIDNEGVSGWVTWKPPHEGFAFNHHLNVEDEIFEYTLRTGWLLPGHSVDGKIIFSMTRLEQSNLVSELDKYWLTWNDCAVTKNHSGEVFVLQTLPGMRFRGRAAEFDHATAVTHLRNMIEAHASLTLDQNRVQELLGMEPGYTPLFENSLRIIPEEQLTPVDWNNPLGTGANGKVYVSTWQNPGGILSTSSSSQIDVVLKEIVSSESNAPKSLQIFMKELNSTYTALGSRPMCCVKFLGITQVTRFLGQGVRLLLVFERATQGEVMPFLNKFLPSLHFFDFWKELADCLMSIATGLAFIHKHGVVHRDLHLGNILVTDEFFPDDVELPHQYSYVISDLGEGKELGKQRIGLANSETAFANYGPKDFRAPEIEQGLHNIDAFAAEVFSFGVVAYKIVAFSTLVGLREIPTHIRASASEDLSGREFNDNHIVPREIQKIISSCLSRQGSERPDMEHVLDALEEVTMMFTKDSMEGKEGQSVEWSYWDWQATWNTARNLEDSDSSDSSDTD